MNKCNTFRIIFRNMDGKYDSGEDRLQDIIKPLYWTDPRADWIGFDGDIEIHKEQDHGGKDAARIIFHNDRYQDWIMQELYKIDVYDIYCIQAYNEDGPYFETIHPR